MSYIKPQNQVITCLQSITVLSSVNTDRFTYYVSNCTGNILKKSKTTGVLYFHDLGQWKESINQNSSLDYPHYKEFSIVEANTLLLSDF